MLSVEIHTRYSGLYKILPGLEAERKDVGLEETANLGRHPRSRTLFFQMAEFGLLWIQSLEDASPFAVFCP